MHNTDQPNGENTNMLIDNKFIIALKAIETAQHEVKAGHEVNLSHILEEVKRSSR